LVPLSVPDRLFHCSHGEMITVRTCRRRRVVARV